jgi:putative ABC transport system substrate-binding protein
MNRRDTLLVLLAFGATPLVSLAQQPSKVWRIGFLDLGARRPAVDSGRYDALLDGMRELGYVVGRNLVLEARFADGSVERLDSLAAELVRLKVDVILTWGTPASQAAQRATTTIPIVVGATSDPVRDGLGASMARPGGNITGMSTGTSEIAQKCVELLSTMVPKLSRVAVVHTPANAGHAPLLYSVQLAGQRLGWEFLPVSVHSQDDIELGFATMARDHAGAVIILPDSSFGPQQISRLALKHRLPSIGVGWGASFAEVGGLMTYGVSTNDNVRRAATFVDRILKGAKPGELPFELPTRFYLIINRRTATSLGLVIPQELMLRADRVIE